MIVRKISLSLLIIMVVNMLVFGAIQPAAAGPLDAADVQVNTTSTNNQQNSAVAMSPDGKSVICWQHWNGSNWDIKARRYDAGGAAQGNDFNVAIGSNHQLHPTVAISPSGSFVISWQEHTGTWDIFFSRFDTNGNSVGGPVNMTPWGLDQTVPSVGMDSSGNFTIAFQHASGGTNDNILYVKYRHDGVNLGTNSVATGANDERLPNITMNQSGDFAVSWQEAVGTNWDVLARKYYSGGGSTAAIPVRVNGNQQGESAVAIDDLGRFVVCWQEYLGSNHDIYAQRYASSGSLQGSKIAVANYSNDQKYPAVAMNVSGSFVVCWQEYTWAGNWDVLSQRYNSSGTSVEWTVTANTVTGNNQLLPAVAVDNNGGSVIAWEADGNQDGNGKGIFRRRYSNISTTWYFAEGYTGEGFEEWLVLQNPNSTPTNATITYMIRGEAAQTKVKALPANSRETISVNTDVGFNKEVSIKVEASLPIIAERPMYFNYQNKWEGGHNAMGATSTSNSWYFAEGYTGDGFEQWLTLQNPNPTNAAVTVAYYFRGGGTTLIKNKTIPANSRETIDVKADVGANQEVSIEIWSAQRIVAERPTYFNYQGKWEGGHAAMGATQAHTDWHFSEGYTGSGFEEWLSLQNPAPFAATATVTYSFKGGGAPLIKTVNIAANSRETVDVNADVGANKEVSIHVSCPSGLVAERPMYFNYQSKWEGGHNTFGVPVPLNQWYFAEGYTGNGFDEWLTLQNPNGATANATVTYTFRGGGAPVVNNLTISANSRETISVNSDVGFNKEVSVKIDSDQPIIAERPIYFNYLDKWEGGHNTMGLGS